MAKRPKKELTRKEKIDAAYKKLNDERQYDGEVAHDFDVPERRRLYAGDKVEIGNLTNCVVIETSPDFKQVIVEYTHLGVFNFEYTHTGNNYGNPTITHGMIGGWYWNNIVKLDGFVQTPFDVEQQYRLHYTTTDIFGMIHRVMHRGVVDNPDYQRGYVWTFEDKLNYIDSVFGNRDLGKFIFVEDSTYRDNRLEALDGKQRLNAIIEFMDSVFPFKGVFWDQLPSLIRTEFKGRQVQTTSIDRNTTDRATLLRTFLNVNAGGVPQTEQHLEHVRKLLEQEEKRS